MEHTDKYIKEKHSIDILKANKFGIKILLITVVGALLLFYVFWPNSFLTKLSNLINPEGIWDFLGGIFTLFIVLVIGVIAHELIHGVFWALFTKKGFSSIKFGILKQYFTPYCHCKEPLKVKHYIIGAIMPAIILGFIPIIAGLMYGFLSWLLFGIFFIAAAGGDFLMINLLRKEHMNDWAKDHPSEAGYYIYRKNV